MKNLISRLNTIATEHFPSIQTPALVMSVLLREVAEFLRIGLCIGGQTLDIVHYRDAYRL
ncbi:hypothetical protein C427_1077 [Paraglaciecola psychrophila 170]|uniref:Uncharacterized protein n=1 Tax=Paraglaciecola psychrophila 170 TaxID=1129794 RepID=K7A993_9ALTE|nr:hypothetical protein C427_1077 [Paraglaciecola psychrophila 170]GAC38862.1 hypothetical protein GPSY_3251 [Paraglaciecola psychrophila 170]